MNKKEKAIYDKDYNEKHKKDRAVQRKEYRLTHRETISAADKKYRDATVEKREIYQKEYRETHKKERAERDAKNREKLAAYEKSYRMLRVYNLTVGEWQEMFNKQKGCCAICGKHQSELGVTLAIDHSHETGKVRGLLCGNCNNGLGRFEDNVMVLQNAIEYLNPIEAANAGLRPEVQ